VFGVPVEELSSDVSAPQNTAKDHSPKFEAVKWVKIIYEYRPSLHKKDTEYCLTRETRKKCTCSSMYYI
jgi:hypothetical protein